VAGSLLVPVEKDFLLQVLLRDGAGEAGTGAEKILDNALGEG
jgi:hypothetical protein